MASAEQYRAEQLDASAARVAKAKRELADAEARLNWCRTTYPMALIEEMSERKAEKERQEEMAEHAAITKQRQAEHALAEAKLLRGTYTAAALLALLVWVGYAAYSVSSFRGFYTRIGRDVVFVGAWVVAIGLFLGLRWYIERRRDSKLRQ